MVETSASSDECGLGSLTLIHEIGSLYNPPHINTE